MKKGKTYNYKEIEEFANQNNFEIEEFGRNCVGENFLKLQHNDKDIVISFVLVGATNIQYIYECVYVN
jgi:hypothetical protein